MSDIGDQIRMDALLHKLEGKDISNLTIILGTCEQCKYNKKNECTWGHRNEFRKPSTFCCIDFIGKEENNAK